MPDPADFVPERVFPPATQTALTTRLSHAMSGGLVALLLNGVVVVFLAYIGWPLQTTGSTPVAISVELVDRVPGEDGPAGTTGDRAAQAGKSGTGKAPERSAQADPDPVPPEAKPALAAKPDPPPAASPETPPAQAATPAPLEHPSDDPQPRLVAAPPDPREASSAPTEQRAAPAPASPPADRPKPVAPSPPSERPDILARADASNPTPPPLPAANLKKLEPTAEERRQAETTAKLAAALPFGQSFMSDPFRASVAGKGVVSADQYRGAVYGAFRKADSIMAEAQAKHLSGQAVVAFTIDDSGALVHAGVAVSSGNTELDRMALAIIQQSAPYPPPPPGAQHSFSPAIGFGLDQ